MTNPLALDLDTLLTPTALSVGLALLSFGVYLSSTLLSSPHPKPNMPLNTTEHTASLELVNEGGQLNRLAAGWARGPIVTSELLPSGAWWGYRSKQWEYWGVISPSLVLGLTLADLDYGTVIQLYLHDRAANKSYTWEMPGIPPNRDLVHLPKTLPPFTCQGQTGQFKVMFADTEQAGKKITTLAAKAPASGTTPAVEMHLEVNTEGESFGVVVPWSDSRFQYTLKAPALPTTGTVKLGEKTYTVNNAWATLDRGRGRWPYRMAWNWGVALGQNSAGQRVGLTIGGRWTDGTGTTENALLLDGVVQGQGPLEDVAWIYDLKAPEKPWKIRGSWIDAEITPWHVRVAGAQKVVMSSFTTQVFGQWKGSATVDGKTVSLDGLTGWAEDAANRW
ncbi:hypothetical protein A1Q2_07895 [Trichosporon asahii var. asahii CBS 8904]|uniref:DUF2804 domain-containing protein n=1 Tax=Trichosporon asahii var. asahii (strain CBS 8904) TaxID=1220162 RepID=K1VME8_TRIAC|nr:hypothetical protein A1Q2_07895 [Trichosporon asahii var. asahii CBS 8904]